MLTIINAKVMNTDNWQRGKRGFQSKLSQEQQLELVEVWIQNDWKTTPAKKWLKEKYGIELKQNTLWSLKDRLKKKWQKVNSDLDKPADWGDFLTLTKNGVPPEHRRELHRIWVGIENSYKRRGLVATKPTYRRLHWWAYVIEYHGDVIKDKADRQYIAEGYALRHMAADLFGLPMETDDLDQWLYYQPWEGGDREAAYLKAIDKGLIPPIKEPLDFFELGDPSDVQIVHAQRILSSRLAQLFAPKPYLLPSQVVGEDLMEAVTRSLESYRGRGAT